MSREFKMQKDDPYLRKSIQPIRTIEKTRVQDILDASPDDPYMLRMKMQKFRFAICKTRVHLVQHYHRFHPVFFFEY